MNPLKKFFTNHKDLVYLFFIITFSAWTLSSSFLISHSAYWDNPKFFSIFRDHLHSLNKFGEIAWWFPQNQIGWPAYYYSILGDTNIGSPLFVVLGLICFALGQIGITIDSYFELYTAYYSILTPALFLIATYYCSTCFYKSKATTIYALTIAAFSPAVMFNLSDLGFLEPLIWFLFFFGSFIRFIRIPEKKSFLKLILSIQVIALTFNYTSLFWNILFIPIIILLFIFYPKQNIKKIFRKIKPISLISWVIALFAIFLCLIPNLNILSQAGNLVRSRMGEKYYGLFDLLSGNPLEAFTVSLPYFGFEWLENVWRLKYASKHISYIYMGILCLPLTIYALINSKTIIFRRFLICFILAFLIFNLSSMSPFFSAILALPSPLKGNNHFGDAFFRAGGFLIILLCATQGFDILQKNLNSESFKKIFSICFLINVILYLTHLNLEVLSKLVFGIYFTAGIMVLIVILRCKSKLNYTHAINFLLFLNLIDVSSIAYSYIRSEMLTNKNKEISEQENPNHLGINDRYLNEYADSILMYQGFFDMLKLGNNPNVIPAIGFYSKIHQQSNIQSELQALTDTSSPEANRSLNLAPEFTQIPPFNNFLNNFTSSNPNGKVELIYQSYQQLKLKITTDNNALFFLRDAYSPYWEATVNDVETPIARAFFNFKAIPVPKGESILSLQFKPPYVTTLYFLAYLSILINLILIFRSKTPKKILIRKQKG
jgi:hypothetical protein